MWKQTDNFMVEAEDGRRFAVTERTQVVTFTLQSGEKQYGSGAIDYKAHDHEGRWYEVNYLGGDQYEILELDLVTTKV